MEATNWSALESPITHGRPAERGRISQQNGFVARHPVWVFVIAPIPLALLVLMGVGLLMVGGAEGAKSLSRSMGYDEAQTTTWVVRVIHSTQHLFRSVPFVCASVVACWVASRRSIFPFWPVLACCLIAIPAAMFQFSVQLFGQPPRGQIQLGFGLSSSASFLAQAMLQALPPLAIAAIYVLHRVINRESHPGQR